MIYTITMNSKEHYASGQNKGQVVKNIPPLISAWTVIKISPKDVGLFRFLLEAWDNAAGFSVLSRRTALLKVFYSPQQKKYVHQILAAIATELDLEIIREF